MKRDDRLRMLSWDHHHGLVMSLRIERELPTADSAGLAALFSDLVSFWSAGLLPHFRTENECLLARLIRHVSPEHEVVRTTQRDHLSLEGLVATMRDTSDEQVRRGALAEFGAKLKAHIRWEESVLFQVTQQQLEDEEMNALGADINERHPEVVPAPGAPPPG